MISQEQTLALAVKVAKDIAGIRGLVSTLPLAFRILPRISVRSIKRPGKMTRIKAMGDARNEIKRIVAQAWKRTALNSNVPGETKRDVRINDKVLIYREKPIQRWMGSYLARDFNGKKLTLDTGDRRLQAFIDKVKLFRNLHISLEGDDMLLYPTI